MPGCSLGRILDDVLKRALGLRAKFVVDLRILIQKMDVKSAFRHVGVDPDGASRFAYRLGAFRVEKKHRVVGARGKSDLRGP